MQEHMEPLKDPTSYTWITYAWVLLLAILGGVVNYVRKIRSGQSPWNIVEFVGELATSALVGLTTFYLCEAANIAPLMTAALVGVTGHMGSRALYQFETSLRRRFRAFMTEGRK